MIGIDLVHIPEFEHQLSVGGDTFLERAFHPEERADNRLEHLAGLWAAKEAVMKAAGLPVGEWLAITIKYGTRGQPIAHLEGHVIDISITHHGEYAVAVAVTK